MTVATVTKTKRDRPGLMRRVGGRLPLAASAVSAAYCLRDPATPFWVKTAAVAGVAYLFLPIDAVPDAILPIGLADDAGVVAGAFTIVSTHITDEHREKARRWLGIR